MQAQATALLPDEKKLTPNVRVCVRAIKHNMS
jgi:hypothetical protein